VPNEQPRSWKVGIRTDNIKEWYYNTLRFATRDGALRYAAVLKARWTAVTDTLVSASDDAPNYSGAGA
jgi:hypothetical protein